MTDPTEPPVPDDESRTDPTSGERADELASAYVDGEASEDVLARVEADDDLADRVGAFTGVSRRLRDVPPPPVGAMDAAWSAAMDAFDARPVAAPAEEGEGGGGGTVRALPTPVPAWRRVPLGAVAAAVAIVALVGVVSLTGGDRDADTSATAAMDLEDGSDRAAGSADGDASLAPEAAMDAGGSTADDAMESFDAEAAPAERLRFSSPDTLSDYLRDQLAARAGAGTPRTGDGDDAGESEPPPPVADADPCDAVALTGLDPASVVVVVPVTLDGRAATAVVHGPQDQERLVVVDDATCDVVVDQPLR